MQTNTKIKKQEFSLEAIKKRAEEAAKKAKKQRNPDTIGYTTIVVEYEGREKLSTLIKKRYQKTI